MKKAFLLLAIVALGLSASAQKFSATFQGRTYANGDTLVLDRLSSFTSVDDFEAIIDLETRNLTGSALQFRVRIDEIESDGLGISICVGQCVPSNLSSVGTLPANGEMDVPIHFAHFDFASTQGFYRVNIFDTEAEGDTLQFFCRVDLSHLTGIARPAAGQLKAYPNPSHGQVTIECPAEGILVVRDLLGRQVLRQPVSGPQRLSLPRGLYTYALEGQPARKLIVK